MGTKTILTGKKNGYCRTCAGVEIFGVDGRGIDRELF